INRPRLNSQYERYIFQSSNSDLTLNDPDKISTTHIPFTTDNIRNALLASGSIPMVMKGIRNIEDSPQGMYRDGGIVDYHFDFEINNNTNTSNVVASENDAGSLVLYPHFNPNPKAGWFDKKSQRKPLAKSYDNIVMLAPTQAFIDLLPNQKIPDRNDFEQLEDQHRIECWQQVLKLSQLLADDFKQFVAQPDLGQIKPLDFAP
ncbi:MAG: patatin-like phospholipase family protein, partial [Gammaproteobacteria bacterium]|nr:patatin-like phospholipase family protein [Gammaproteobacteria bacterium]